MVSQKVVHYLVCVEITAESQKKSYLFCFDSVKDDIELQLGRLRRFFLHELLVGTQNFKDEHILQRASNSVVYEGCLVDGSKVAVKRFKYGGGSDQDVEFQNEVEINSITAHPNVLGFCIAPKERLLVYRSMASESPSPGFTGKVLLTNSVLYYCIQFN